jgi:hypothetical protein
LKVIVCKDCKFLMEEKMHAKVWTLIFACAFNQVASNKL